MKSKTLAVAALTVAAAQAGAVTLTFDDLAAGSTLSNQYAALGAVFSPNAFSGPGSSSSLVDWATSTGLTIAGSNDVQSGGLGAPALASGNLLHGFHDWLNADGDPSFRIAFTGAVTSISVDFVSVDVPAADSRLFVYDGATLLGTVAGSASGTDRAQFTLSFAAASITSVVVAPGSFNDWVGVDNISYTVAAVPVPEPGTWALMALGVGGLLLRRRRAG